MQTLEELIELTEEYRRKLSDITSYDDRIGELTLQRDTQYNKVKAQAALLTKARVLARRRSGEADGFAIGTAGYAQRAFSSRDGVSQRARVAGRRHS